MRVQSSSHRQPLAEVWQGGKIFKAQPGTLKFEARKTPNSTTKGPSARLDVTEDSAKLSDLSGANLLPFAHRDGIGNTRLEITEPDSEGVTKVVFDLGKTDALPAGIGGMSSIESVEVGYTRSDSIAPKNVEEGTKYVVFGLADSEDYTVYFADQAMNR